MNKTYAELEEMGIISAFRDDMVLYVITKGGKMWKYLSTEKVFSLYKVL
jgi:hypothetical protein